MLRHEEEAQKGRVIRTRATPQDADVFAGNAARAGCRAGQTRAGAPGGRQALLQRGALPRLAAPQTDASGPSLANGACPSPHPEARAGRCFLGLASAVWL